MSGEGETGNMAHEAPDQALKAVGEWMEGSVADSDWPAPHWGAEAYWDLPPANLQDALTNPNYWKDDDSTLTAGHGLTWDFWPLVKDENGNQVYFTDQDGNREARRRAPTPEEADEIFIREHLPGGQFYEPVRQQFTDEEWANLLPNQRMALQSWAHQQGWGNFVDYFEETEDGRALKEAIVTGDRDEIARLWYSPHEKRRRQMLFLYFYGVPLDPDRNNGFVPFMPAGPDPHEEDVFGPPR